MVGVGEELLAHRGVPDDRLTWSAKAVTRPDLSRYAACGPRGLPGRRKPVSDLQQLWRDAGRLWYPTRSSSEGLRGSRGRLPARQWPRRPFDESCRVLASLPPLVESYRPDLALKDHALAVKYYRSLCDRDAGRSRRWLDRRDAVVVGRGHGCHGCRIRARAAWQRRWTKDRSSKRELFVSMCVKEGGVVRSGEKASEAVRRVVEHWIASGPRHKTG